MCSFELRRPPAKGPKIIKSGLFYFFEIYIIATTCFGALCFGAGSRILLELFSMLLHPLVHLPETFLYPPGGPEQRQREIKDQFISQVKQEGIKKKP